MIAASGATLTVIKWAGVVYLIWLGLRMIQRASHAEYIVGGLESAVSLKTLWMQGFITSAANPKAVVFFAALFPQFVEGGRPFWPQFLILSATCIVMDGCFLSACGSPPGGSPSGSRFGPGLGRAIGRMLHDPCCHSSQFEDNFAVVSAPT